MQTLAEIRRLLAERGVEPKKSLGQNFLIDHNLLRKLVEAARVGPGDLVLEVGPGTGTLTEELLARGCRVVACELDDVLSRALGERSQALPGGANLRVVHADVLGPDRRLAPAVREALAVSAAPAGPGGPEFVLAANLPYGAATPLISDLLVNHPNCRRLAVTIQSEVADRIAARPRTKEYGGLSVVAQALATVTRLATLPRECFWPRPEVTSAMLLLERRADPLTSDPAGLSDFCRLLFARRRRQLGATLGRSHQWPPGVEPTQRPEELTVQQVEGLRLVVAAADSQDRIGIGPGQDPGARPTD